MTDLHNAAPRAVISPGLPDYQRRLIELDDDISKIRTQIATADLARQRGQKPICLSPLKLCQSWFSFGDGINGAETVFG